MARFPTLEAGERVFSVLRLRNGDERLRWAAAPADFLPDACVLSS
jgi:hypothetical protein